MQAQDDKGPAEDAAAAAGEGAAADQEPTAPTAGKGSTGAGTAEVATAGVAAAEAEKPAGGSLGVGPSTATVGPMGTQIAPLSPHIMSGSEMEGIIQATVAAAAAPVAGTSGPRVSWDGIGNTWIIVVQRELSSVALRCAFWVRGWNIPVISTRVQGSLIGTTAAGTSRRGFRQTKLTCRFWQWEVEVCYQETSIAVLRALV